MTLEIALARGAAASLYREVVAIGEAVGPLPPKGYLKLGIVALTVDGWLEASPHFREASRLATAIGDSYVQTVLPQIIESKRGHT